MQFFRFIQTLAMLIAFTAANPLAKAKLVSRAEESDCNGPTFQDETTSASPSVADCQKIVSNISGGGSWEIEGLTDNQHQIVQYHSCAFGVQTPPGQSGVYSLVNTDIINIIKTSIEKYQSKGRVGAKGNINCDITDSDGLTVEWGIYHT